MDTIQDIKQQIWQAAGKNLYKITVAKSNINFRDDWQALLQEVKRLSAIPPVNTDKPVPIPSVEHNHIARYINAHKHNFEQQYPSAFASGHWFKPTIPAVNSTNGLTRYCIDCLNFLGHHAERTNTMGRPVTKKVPKFNLWSGKVEHIDGGIEWQKGTGKKGSSDIKGHILNPRFPAAIAIYIEIKYNKDRMSKDQEKYEVKINKTGSLYAVVKTPDDFWNFYDHVISL